MIRVLSVGSVSPEHGGKTRGGVARFHSALIKSWIKHPELGIEVVAVAALNSDENSDPITGVPYLQNRKGNSSQRMISIIEESNPDCIIFHHISNAWAASIEVMENLPTTIGFAHSWLYCREENDPRYPTNLNRAKKSLSKLNHLLFLSKHCRDEMYEFIENPKCDISIIPPPLSQLSANNKSIRIHSSRNLQRIVYLGNLLSHKNPMPLVKSMQHLNDVELILIGSGKEESSIKRYIIENKLSDVVKIENDLTDSQISEYFNSADAFCLPSQYEAFGLVYLEALDHGLPLIGYGPSLDTIETEMGIKCGFPLTEYTPEVIASTIFKCLNYDWDRETLQKRVREVFNPYSISKRFAELIKEIHICKE